MTDILQAPRAELASVPQPTAAFTTTRNRLGAYEVRNPAGMALCSTRYRDYAEQIARALNAQAVADRVAA